MVEAWLEHGWGMVAVLVHGVAHIGQGQERRNGETDAKPANLLATFDLYHQQCFIYVFAVQGI